MPITARERAQKALDKLNADVEKARAKHDKLAAKREAATAASGAAALDLHALIAERDHLASHPALRDSEPVDETFAVVAEAEPQAEPVQAAEPEPSFVPGQPHLGTPAAQAEPVATSAASAFDPFAKDPFAPSA